MSDWEIWFNKAIFSSQLWKHIASMLRRPVLKKDQAIGCLDVLTIQSIYLPLFQPSTLYPWMNLIKVKIEDQVYDHFTAFVNP